MASKNLIGLASVLACVGATPTHAAPTSFKVSGTVPNVCSLQSVAMNPSVTVSNGGNNVAVNSPSSWLVATQCNAPTILKISARSLRNVTPKTTLNNNESQTLNYTATASGWTTTAATTTTNDTAVGSPTTFFESAGSSQTRTSAGIANVTVSYGALTTATAGASGSQIKPTTGSYSATITLTLTPS